MFKRELSTLFILLKPDVLLVLEKKPFTIKKKGVDCKRKIAFSPFRVNEKGRSEGIIVKEIFPPTFNVKFKDGTISKNHKNPLIKTKF